MDAGDPNFGLHACVTSTAATEPSPSLLFGSLILPHNGSCLENDLNIMKKWRKGEMMGGIAASNDLVPGQGSAHG